MDDQSDWEAFFDETGDETGENWSPSVASLDGRAVQPDAPEPGSLWIRHLLSLCDDPRRPGRPGKVKGLYRQGLLAMWLREEGMSFRMIATMLNRDVAHVSRMDRSTREAIAEMITSGVSTSEILTPSTQPSVIVPIDKLLACIGVVIAVSTGLSQRRFHSSVEHSCRMLRQLKRFPIPSTLSRAVRTAFEEPATPEGQSLRLSCDRLRRMNGHS